MLATRRTRIGRDLLELVAAGTYLTDGERLLRVERGFADPDANGLALLEDCGTLEMYVLSANELCTQKLEFVSRSSRGD
jgi:hypothetical protein